MLQQFELGEMKAWLLECFDDEYDQEQIKELSYEHAVKAINHYYDGGIKAFREVSQMWREVEA